MAVSEANSSGPVNPPFNTACPLRSSSCTPTPSSPTPSGQHYLANEPNHRPNHFSPQKFKCVTTGVVFKRARILRSLQTTYWYLRTTVYLVVVGYRCEIRRNTFERKITLPSLKYKKSRKKINATRSLLHFFSNADFANFKYTINNLLCPPKRRQNTTLL